MARYLSLWTALVVLVLGPALCLSGVFEHACDCGDAGVEDACEHESSCSDDPCGALSLAPQQDEVGPTMQAALHQPACIAAGPFDMRSACTAEPRAPPLCSNLPYAQSDRPLLI